MIGLIFVILLLDSIIPGVVPKRAIFAPGFIPIFVRLNVAPQTVLAAYRVGDSPMNSVTPLMVYLPFIVTVAQRYDKKAGLGTIISLMVPYVIAILSTWLLLFIAWWLLGIQLGPGSPIEAKPESLFRSDTATSSLTRIGSAAAGYTPQSIGVRRFTSVRGAVTAAERGSTSTRPARPGNFVTLRVKTTRTVKSLCEFTVELDTTVTPSAQPCSQTATQPTHPNRTTSNPSTKDTL